jgi:hypothetical protein
MGPEEVEEDPMTTARAQEQRRATVRAQEDQQRKRKQFLYPIVLFLALEVMKTSRNEKPTENQ